MKQASRRFVSQIRARMSWAPGVSVFAAVVGFFLEWAGLDTMAGERGGRRSHSVQSGGTFSLFAGVYLLSLCCGPAANPDEFLKVFSRERIGRWEDENEADDVRFAAFGLVHDWDGSAGIH